MKPAGRTVWRFGASGEEAGASGEEASASGEGAGIGGGGTFTLPRQDRADLALLAAVAQRQDTLAVTMLLATAIAQAGRPVVVCEPRHGRRRAAGLISTAPARGLAEIVAARFDDLKPVSRGLVCHLSLPDGPAEFCQRLDWLLAALPVSAVCLAGLEADLFRHLLDDGAVEINSAAVLAELPRDRAQTALVCGELSERGIRCRVWRPTLRAPRKQLALAGLAPGGPVGAAAQRMVKGLGLEAGR